MNIELFLNWIFYILTSISITHILVGGSIFGPLRSSIIDSKNKIIEKLKIKDLIMCYQCSGFWVGISTSPIFVYYNYMNNTNSLYNNIKTIIIMLSCGFIVSLLSDLFYRIKQYLCDQCG